MTRIQNKIRSTQIVRGPKAQKGSQTVQHALQRIENSAYLASMGDSSALIDVDTLKELANHTNFDAVRYVDRDGNNLSSDGQVCQIQDRSYLKRDVWGKWP
ncbi:hypothetical protein [Dubosiella newyorkensis]|uniref:hypothetical protein n=1 Tax=Dubosiella newyorkensis TaxID=1862672 RepID=UPI003F6695B4